jgi:hypothetical protein
MRDCLWGTASAVTLNRQNQCAFRCRRAGCYRLRTIEQVSSKILRVSAGLVVSE